MAKSVLKERGLKKIRLGIEGKGSIACTLGASGSAALLCFMVFSGAGKARGWWCLSCWGWVAEWPTEGEWYPTSNRLQTGVQAVSGCWALCTQLRWFLLTSWVASHTFCPLVSTQNLLCALFKVTMHLYSFRYCVLGLVSFSGCEIKKVTLSGRQTFSFRKYKTLQWISEAQRNPDLWNKHHVIL